MNEQLAAAVAIFVELGWKEASPEQALTLPLGTPQQRKTVVASLSHGEWVEWGSHPDGASQVIAKADVDLHMLGLFAVRAGVDARRAVRVLRDNSEVATAVVAERGPKFATSFIRHACTDGMRAWHESASYYGGVAVSLVEQFDLPVPDNVEYLRDWAAFAASAMGITVRLNNPGDRAAFAALSSAVETELNDPQRPPGKSFNPRRRFAEHIRAGAAAGIPGTGPFSQVLPEGVARGWFDREEALELTFTALDTATRPSHRKAWCETLDALGVSTEELIDRTPQLIPLLSSGETFIIERFAPPLIAGTDEATLSEVLLASLSSSVKKVQRIVLQAALERAHASGSTLQLSEGVFEQLTELARDRDRKIAQLASQLRDECFPQTHDSLPSNTDAADSEGLWQVTPPLWNVPRFQRGEVTPEDLTGLAAELTQRSADFDDVLSERFLVVANELARIDPHATRAALRGVSFGAGGVLSLASCWLDEEWSFAFGSDRFGVSDPLEARDYAVFVRLGELPCVLSEPSWDDLSISFSDLVSRIEQYAAAGTPVQEADLLLALTRLDLNSVDPAASLQKLKKVPVVLQSGDRLKMSAADAVRRWLDEPVAEPALHVEREYLTHWAADPVQLPRWLKDFTERLAHEPTFTWFPRWGDAAFTGLVWSSEPQRNQGLLLRQAVRRKMPLPPGVAINLLASGRSIHPVAAADSRLAVVEAWERGILQPDIAQLRYLDWTPDPPKNLASFAVTLEEIAREGLLSVVWPVLDDLLMAALKAPRIAAGTAEVAGAMLALLPEVQAAVASRLAAPSALDVPGARALASRGGSSIAVVIARELVAQLPPAASSDTAAVPDVSTGAPDSVSNGADVMSSPVDDFDEVWPAGAGTAPLIPDQVRVTVDWADPAAANGPLAFDLILPQHPDVHYVVVKPAWFYDLEMERQCNARELPLGVSYSGRDPIVGYADKTWLYWDTDRKELIVSNTRNRSEDASSPPEWALTNPFAGPRPPLSDALVTVVIGLLAQDGDAKYYAPSIVRAAVTDPKGFGSAAVKLAARILLASPAINPAGLVRALEKDVVLLPVLWPLLTESVRQAGIETARNSKPPRWANRVLDAAAHHAPYLAEATCRGLIPADDAQWEGLDTLASSRAKSTAVSKARTLHQSLGLT